MIFSASDFTIEQKSPDGNKKQSFVSLPPDPNGRNKNIGVHCLHSPVKPSKTPHSGQIKKDWPQAGLHRCTRGNLGQPTSHRGPNLDLRKPEVAYPSVAEPRWCRSSENKDDDMIRWCRMFEVPDQHHDMAETHVSTLSPQGC
jgi:hypothetical protein